MHTTRRIYFTHQAILIRNELQIKVASVIIRYRFRMIRGTAIFGALRELLVLFH